MVLERLSDPVLTTEGKRGVCSKDNVQWMNFKYSLGVSLAPW